LGKDGMTQRAGAVATFLRVANFKDQLHIHRIHGAGTLGGCALWRRLRWAPVETVLGESLETAREVVWRTG
jgi:hypothetical protein